MVHSVVVRMLDMATKNMPEEGEVVLDLPGGQSARMKPAAFAAYVLALEAQRASRDAPADRARSRTMPREPSATGKPVPRPREHSDSPPRGKPSLAQERLERAVKCLRAVKASGPEGAEPEAVRSAVGVKSLNGLGGVRMFINGMATAEGIDPLRVIKLDRRAAGKRWVPGKAIDDMIRIVEGKLAEEAGA